MAVESGPPRRPLPKDSASVLYGPRLDVLVRVSLDVTMWEDGPASVWVSQRGGGRFPLSAFPSPRESRVFRAHLVAAFAAVGRAAAHRTALETVDTDGRHRSHPVSADVEVTLGDRTAVDVYPGPVPIVSEEPLRATVITIYEYVLESYRVARLLGAVAQEDRARLLHGYETAAVLATRVAALPGSDDDLPAFLAEHAGLPSAWLHWMHKARMTHTDGLALLRSVGPEVGLETLILRTVTND